MRFAIIFFFYLLFLFFAIPAVDSPLTYDEAGCVLAAQSLLTTGKPEFFAEELSVTTTRLHIDLQSYLYKLFGISHFSSRLLGIICIFLQLLIFLFLSRLFFKEPTDQRKFLFFASFIFASNPAVIQGALIPFEDTTLLPIGISLFILFFLKLKNRIDLKNSLILGFFFAVSLWPKPTTPWVIIPALFIYYLLNKNKKGVLYTITILTIGIFLFLVYWILYSWLNGLDWLEPIRYYFYRCFLKRSGYYRTFGSVSLFYLLAVIRLILWMGLYTFLLVLVTVIKRTGDFIRKRYLEEVDLFIIYALLGGAAYILIGGTVFGFPKYHYPLFFAFAVISASMMTNYWKGISRRDLLLYFGLAALASLYLYFFVGDLIYIFNFRIKDAMINNPLMFKRAALYFIYKYILYLLPGIAVFFILRNYKKSYTFTTQAVITLTIMACASNLSLDLIQSKADYLTRLCYGAKGTEELVEYLKENLSGDETILATHDIIYYLRDKNIPYPPCSPWHDLDMMMGRIADPSVKFVIYSVTHNSASQFRDIFYNPIFTSRLKQDFSFKKIGTYDVWERKGRAAE